MEYALIRSGRKTIAIHITEDAELVVRAPLRTPKADIDRLVRAKQSWIDKHMARRELQWRQRSAFTLRYGDRPALLGARLPIRAQAGKHAGVDKHGFYMPPDLDCREIKAVMIQIYKTAAKAIVTDRVTYYAGVMKLFPSAVKINSAKTRWGSCSGKNSLNFSWRLVLADISMLDYVVVHELAHIAEHNHSDRFWRVVESVLPDYRERQRGLKALQERLSKEDWDV